jgi:hypothetical protein
MFLCALARPRYNNTTRQWFGGLIVIYPVGEFDMYKRQSANHDRGDLKWTDISLDRDEYQQMTSEDYIVGCKHTLLQSLPGICS